MWVQKEEKKRAELLAKADGGNVLGNGSESDKTDKSKKEPPSGTGMYFSIYTRLNCTSKIHLIYELKLVKSHL